MQVVHVAFECAPIYKTGGLGDVVGALPKYQKDLGIDVAVVMPGYGFITPIPRLPNSTVPVLYAQSPFFQDRNIHHDPKIQAPKYADFAVQVLAELKKRSIRPDIIHCHDWHTGLLPFLARRDPQGFFQKTKIVLSIHNIGYQGIFPLKFLNTPTTARLLPLFNQQQNRLNFLKTAIEHCDYLLTVSPNHAREIKKGQLGFGLAGVIRKKRGKFSGILNGIDYQVWNPKTDKFVRHTYTFSDIQKQKAANKLNLQKRLKLEINADIPLLGLVARLSRQKGIELILSILPDLPKRRVQLVLLGTGEARYEKILARFSRNRRYGEWISLNLKFDEELAHQIYAAADFFLIPSLYEPCGLTQMIAMKYGSLPIATAVGGLVDTIQDGKTGLLVDKFSSKFLLDKIDTALDIWEDQKRYLEMQKLALRQKFSWKKSARQYLQVYKKLLR